MRCQCCDRIMRPAEIIWYEEQKRFEEFCTRCKRATKEAYTMLFKDDPALKDEDADNGDAAPIV